MNEALFWLPQEKNAVQCLLCPHKCLIPDGKNGLCIVRKNTNGKLIAEAYGKITSIALDPIEKKPLNMFYPGAKILSVGSYGCNFRCKFCQNHEIAMPANEISAQEITPAALLELSLQTAAQGNIGIAYTYNEPFINFEFILDCAKLTDSVSQKNVLVTNGFISAEPLQTILPYIHAMNIDLKSFSEDFYKNVCGRLSDVKNTIQTAEKHCHIEITTLLIPDENENHIEPIAKWLSEINPEIPLHISRFFPRNYYTNREETSRETVFLAVETARKYLRNVFAGNI